MNYDKILIRAIGYEKIRYGILLGNEKIVFIKVGADGSIRGYQDKCLRMAHRIRERIGATVICASNPDLSNSTHVKSDGNLIKKIIAERGFENYEMYFVGTSDGGEHSLKLAQHFPETVKFLGINSSWSTMEAFLARIQSLPLVKKIFVYGANDVDFDDIVPKLKALDCDNLEIVVLDGVDHEFTERIDDFIALIDLL